MNKAFAGLFVILAMILPVSSAGGAVSPVSVSHTLTGYSKGSATVTLDYSLHVVNAGDNPLTNLSLSQIPLFPFANGAPPVTVDYLAPHQGFDVSFTVTTPILLGADRFTQTPLFWAGKCFDGEGKPLEFPVKSKPGGVE